MWATRSQKKPAPGKPAPKTPAPSRGGGGIPVATKLPPCWAVTFSPDGTKLAVGTYRRVQIYEVATGNKLGDWSVATDAVRTLSYSADGALLAVGTGVPGISGAVLLLNTASGQVVKALKPHYDTVESVAFLGNQLVSAANDEKICVTDLTSGQTIGTLSEHVGRCLAVAVPSRTSPQEGGALFASGGADKMFKVWDAEKRRVVVNFDQCGSVVWCVAAHPQPGRFVVGSGDGAIRVFTVRSDGKARDPKEPDPRVGSVGQTFGGAHPDGVYAIAVASNGQLVASGGADKKLKLWNLGRNRLEKEFTEATADIWAVAISPNSQFVAAASLDGRVRLYDAPQLKLIQEFPPMPGTPGTPQ